MGDTEIHNEPVRNENNCEKEIDENLKCKLKNKDDPTNWDNNKNELETGRSNNSFSNGSRISLNSEDNISNTSEDNSDNNLSSRNTENSTENGITSETESDSSCISSPISKLQGSSTENLELRPRIELKEKEESSSYDNTPKKVPCLSVQNSPKITIQNYETKKHSSELSLEEITDELLNDTDIKYSVEISKSYPNLSANSSSQNNISTVRSNSVVNGITGSISNHPAYRTAMQDLLSLREEVGKLKDECDRLEKEKSALEADRSPEIFQLQLETLEKTVAQQADQLEFARQEAFKQDEAAVAALASARIQYDKLKREYETANRERESTVVRYAVSERELIKLKDEASTYEKRLLEASREKDVLLTKLKTAAAEKSRACHALDLKCAEVSSHAREIDKLKDEINSRDIKIKWAQNKIRSELETHKETQQKLDKVSYKLQESLNEIDQVKKDAQMIVKSCQQGREDKTHQLELQVQEQKAQLITERHARQDAEEARKAALAEVADVKAKHQALLDENNALSVKVQSLEKDRFETEQRLSTFQQAEQQRCQVEADNESLTLQLQQQEERRQASQAEVERLRQSNVEFVQDAQACREREAELLAYTQKLTDKVVRLQSESSATQARAQQMEAERDPLARQVSELEVKLRDTVQELSKEKSARLEESQLLARRVAEKQEYAERLAAQLEEARGEIVVLKRKQTQATKELTREVHQCRKRLEHYEGSGSMTSRASSLTSLNETSATPARQQVNHDAASLDPQMLIEHIGKLQRKVTRQTEKIEFLEEHTRTLVAEVQRKARLVQGLVMREEGGALSSRASDRSKAELSRHGGVMASVYTSIPSDEGMTLELSLEINKKLQAVLEDTLLKNITLKENMDTLGQEIERLSAQLTALKRVNKK